MYSLLASAGLLAGAASAPAATVTGTIRYDSIEAGTYMPGPATTVTASGASSFSFTFDHEPILGAGSGAPSITHALLTAASGSLTQDGTFVCFDDKLDNHGTETITGVTDPNAFVNFGLADDGTPLSVTLDQGGMLAVHWTNDEGPGCGHPVTSNAGDYPLKFYDWPGACCAWFAPNGLDPVTPLTVAERQGRSIITRGTATCRPPRSGPRCRSRSPSRTT